VLTVAILVVAIEALRSLGIRGPMRTPAPVQTLVDAPLNGGTSWLQYLSIDWNRRLLCIAHLGASTAMVVDPASQKGVQVMPNVASVHRGWLSRHWTRSIMHRPHDILQI
jgi:hypothetical protein